MEGGAEGLDFGFGDVAAAGLGDIGKEVAFGGGVVDPSLTPFEFTALRGPVTQGERLMFNRSARTAPGR
jgi:hypothetical protein